MSANVEYTLQAPEFFSYPELSELLSGGKSVHEDQYARLPSPLQLLHRQTRIADPRSIAPSIQCQTQEFHVPLYLMLYLVKPWYFSMLYGLSHYRLWLLHETNDMIHPSSLVHLCH